MVRFYTFIVCLVLLLGMSRCVPAWADQPSASHGYDAATHYDHSLDSDCQSTSPGCAYVAQEHKTDCAHSESRANNTGLFGILCWSSIIVVGYLSVSRDYDTPNNKLDNPPHRPNYDVRIELRCTSTMTLKNEMSQYRAYFVPNGVDPFGLKKLVAYIKIGTGTYPVYKTFLTCSYTTPVGKFQTVCPGLYPDDLKGQSTRTDTSSYLRLQRNLKKCARHVRTKITAQLIRMFAP